jgi:hypothetical protein
MSEAPVQDQGAAVRIERRSLWSQLSAEHRSYMIWQAIVGAAIVNLILNSAIAWLTAHNEDTIPRWATPLIDGPSTITDTVGTLFILPLLTCLIFTALAQREIRAGKLQPLGWTRESHPFLRRLPEGTLKRGLAAGAITTLVLGPPMVAAIIALGIGDVSVGGFVAYKAVFGVALGLVVTPILALWALQSPEAIEAAQEAAKEPIG